jgi:mRNA-degrading endonuclease RelE of RelBE toxin-antitoxin system
LATIRLTQIAIAETDAFEKAAASALTTEEVDSLKSYLSYFPEAGALIPRSGGIRKLRWRAKGKGKRSGARVIYYYRNDRYPILLLTVFTKERKVDLTPFDLKILRRIVDEF